MHTGHHTTAAPLHDAYPIETNPDQSRSVTKLIRLSSARPTSRTPRSPPPTTPTKLKPPSFSNFSPPSPLSQHALAPTPPSPSQISNLKSQISNPPLSLLTSPALSQTAHLKFQISNLKSPNALPTSPPTAPAGESIRVHSFNSWFPPLRKRPPPHKPFSLLTSHFPCTDALSWQGPPVAQSAIASPPTFPAPRESQEGSSH
jgi:hypothetical protein